MLHHITSLTNRLSEPATRRRVYLACVMLLYLLALTLMTAKALFSRKEPHFDFACSDGRYYYQYLPSVILDRDLDFSNQLQVGWGVAPPYNAEMEHDRVKYPIGVALSLTPSFIGAHLLSLPLHAITGKEIFAPNGYSIVYQLLNLGMVMLLVCATMMLLDAILTRTCGIDGTWTALSIVMVILGTQYLYHTVRFPGMAHVFSTFWVTATIACTISSVRALQEENRLSWHFAALVFCFAMAIVCRMTNVVMAIFPLYALLVALQHRRFVQLAVLAPMMLTLCFPIVLQLLVWKQMFGVYLPSTYNHGEFVEPFYWSHPQLWNNLFSLKAGVLIWCPVWTIGLIGAAVAFRKHVSLRWILGVSFIAFLALWYVNSAWWCWPLSNYPGRGFVELSVLPAIGLAWLFQSLSRRNWVVGIATIAAVLTIAGSIAYDLKLVPRYADELLENATVELRRR